MIRALATLLLAASGSAWAQAPLSTEIFHQAASGKQEVTPRIQMNTTEREQGGGKVKIEQMPITVSYEYGMNDNWSLGGLIGHSSGKFKTGAAKTDMSGLMDLNLYARGQYAAGPGSFHTGIDLFVSTGDREIKDNGDENMSSGGNTAQISAGYAIAAGPGVAGAKLSTAFDLGDRTEKDKTGGTTTTSKLTGGNLTALTGFYEHPCSNGLIGVSLTWDGRNTTEKKSGGNTATSEGFNTAYARIYGTYKAQETTTILANLDYGKIMNDTLNGTKIDSSSILNLGLAARFEF